MVTSLITVCGLLALGAWFWFGVRSASIDIEKKAQLAEYVCKLIEPRIQIGALRDVEDFLIASSRSLEKRLTPMILLDLKDQATKVIGPALKNASVAHVCKFSGISNVRVEFHFVPERRTWGQKISVYFAFFFGILVVGLGVGLVVFRVQEVQNVRLLERTKVDMFSRMAAQVAHDIRSPLSALAVVEKDLHLLPENTRLMVRSAVGRIRDIANNLIEKNRTLKPVEGVAGVSGDFKGAVVASEVRTTQLLSALIDSLVTEKRLQFRDRIQVDIAFDLDRGGYGLFADVQATELKRVLSNLINNSVEAIAERGQVNIRLEPAGQYVLIQLTDTGKGIAPEVLKTLGTRGATHGKAGGSGLGVFHAKTTVESWGGSLEVTSQVGRGTTIGIRLPRAEAPVWFMERLAIAPGTTVVVLDDDASIHPIWDGRLGSMRAAERGVGVVHFSAPADFQRWVEDHEQTAAFFLMDYELLGHNQTGLDLIQANSLAARAVLVTSRFEEPAVLERCSRLGVRLIPKGLAGLVPMEIRE